MTSINRLATAAVLLALSGCGFHATSVPSSAAPLTEQSMSSQLSAKALDVPGTEMYDLSSIVGISSATVTSTNSNFTIDANHSVVLNTTPVDGMSTDFTITTATQKITLHVTVAVAPQTASIPKIWGTNANGNVLLNGATGTVIAPATASLTTLAFKQLSASNNFVCGLTTDGTAYCWGTGSHGQLGNNAVSDQTVPVAAQTSVKFKFIATPSANWAGDRAHACAISIAGKAYCWGQNSSGQLGDGTTLDHSVPTAVSSNEHFTSLSLSGSMTCGLTDANAVYCWGKNDHGQLGQGTTTSSSVPLRVSGSYSVLATGDDYFCAIDTSKHIVCWGHHNFGSETYINDYTTTTDDDTFPRLLVPTMLDNSREYTSLTGSASNYCSLTADGTAYCWGYTMYGRLGDASNTFYGIRYLPTQIQGTTKFKSISSGLSNTIGIDLNDNAWSWGQNEVGEAGVNRVTDNNNPIAGVETAGYGLYVPVPLYGSDKYASVTVGSNFALGITK